MGAMRTRQVLSLFVLAVTFSLGARAQDDLALVSTSVPPNVMILYDNSGSMSHAIWHQDFDPDVFYDTGAVRAECTIGDVPAIAGSAGYCPGSGDAADQCPSSGSSFRSGGVIACNGGAFAAGNDCDDVQVPAGWVCRENAGRLEFTLPDLTAGGATRWSRNYLSWLFSNILADTAPLPIPDQDRMDSAREAILTLIDRVNPDGFPERVRFGLTQFNTGGDPSGGTVSVAITPANKAPLIAAIRALTPSTWTPLAETLADIGEYMSGDPSVASCAIAAVAGAASPMDDWCRKNFVVILTDGEPTRDDFSNAPGIADFMCAIGNADGDTNEVPDAATGRTDAPPYQSQGTDWLDDVSFSLYERDLRADLQDQQNIVTYTIGFTIDHPLLSDTAANSAGLYYIANDSVELAATLETALQDIIERATSFSAATVPASRTAFGDGFYVAWFTPREGSPFWDGHLEAFRLSSALEVLDAAGSPAIDAATGAFLEPKNPFWDTAERLTDPLHPARQIFTTKGGVRTNFTPADIDAADLNVLGGELTLYPNDPGSPFPDTEALTDAIVNYLYGEDAFDEDRDLDSGELREYVLGDIFHSSPIAIGPPPFTLASEEGFGPPQRAGTFLNQFSQRDRRLFVGANDGMLHAIDIGSYQNGDNPLTPEAETAYYDVGSGNEMFAWVPGLLLQTLKFIPRNQPRSYYYVDASPAAADAWFPFGPGDPTKDPSEWTTVLMTGLRQGGDGYLALDVTDPDAALGPHAPYPRLLWEFDDPAEPMGESWSEPIITRVKMSGPMGFGDHCAFDDGEGDCREQWVAIFAGGFRADADPNLPPWVDDPLSPAWSPDSKAIFIVALDTGAVLARLAYDPADGQLQRMLFALPSTPAVLDLDFDGFADVLYVGDAGGQLWKWDISGVGRVGPFGLVDNWPYGVFFETPPVATAAGLHYRSIFFPPSAAYVNDNEDLVLAFGTGERTELDYQGDGAADDNNRYYKILDPEPTGIVAIPATPYTEADLTDITGLPDDPDPTDLGYFFVVPEAEKFITNSIIFGGFVITASFLPDDGSGGVCDSSGEAFVHIFNLDTGVGYFDPADADVSADGRTLLAGVGVPSAPKITTSDVGTSKLFIQTSAGRIVVLDAPPGGDDVVDVVYWKQDF